MERIRVNGGGSSRPQVPAVRATAMRTGDSKSATTSRRPYTPDSYENLLSGMGGMRDKTTYTAFVLRQIDANQLEAAYRSDWMARKVIDIPAYDSTREWRTWQADRKDITAIEELENTLNLKRKLMRALMRARLYGGGALVMGIDQGRPEDPVNLQTLGRGSLKFIHAVSRYDLSAGPLNDDITSEFYGEPQYYESMSTGTGVQVRLHPSRVVRLIGAELPRTNIADGWGDPILQIIMDAIMQGGSVMQGVAQLVQETQVDVIKIPGLSENVTSKQYEERLKKRFGLAATARSLYNMLLLDKDEDWQRITANLNSLSDIARMYLEVVSGAADIPATRMLGQAPQGMNATGVSDIRNYYDRIASDQESNLTPAMERCDEVLIRSALGAAPEEVFYEWVPLWQMDEVQKAEVAAKKATTFKADVDTGLLDQQVLKRARENQLIEDGTYPGFEQILEEENALIEAGQREEQAMPGNEPEDPDEGGDPESAANENDPAPRKAANDRKRQRIKATDASTPRTLYVYRPVINGKEIIAHYKKQGIKKTLNADDLHVTIIFSKQHVDWSEFKNTPYGQDENGRMAVPPGSMRLMEQFGEAKVLLFAASELAWRHSDFKHRGCSWDHDDFTPHITITYGDVDLADIEPWQGKIMLGPEKFEEVNEAYRAGLVEDHIRLGRRGND